MVFRGRFFGISGLQWTMFSADEIFAYMLITVLADVVLLFLVLFPPLVNVVGCREDPLVRTWSWWRDEILQSICGPLVVVHSFLILYDLVVLFPDSWRGEIYQRPTEAMTEARTPGEAAEVELVRAEDVTVATTGKSQSTPLKRPPLKKRVINLDRRLFTRTSVTFAELMLLLYDSAISAEPVLVFSCPEQLAGVHLEPLVSPDEIKSEKNIAAAGAAGVGGANVAMSTRGAAEQAESPDPTSSALELCEREHLSGGTYFRPPSSASRTGAPLSFRTFYSRRLGSTFSGAADTGLTLYPTEGDMLLAHRIGFLPRRDPAGHLSFTTAPQLLLVADAWWARTYVHLVNIFLVLWLGFGMFGTLICLLSDDAMDALLHPERELKLRQTLQNCVILEEINRASKKDKAIFRSLMPRRLRTARLLLRKVLGIRRKVVDRVLRVFFGVMGRQIQTPLEYQCAYLLAMGEKFTGALPPAYLEKGKQLDVSAADDVQWMTFMLLFQHYTWIPYGYQSAEEEVAKDKDQNNYNRSSGVSSSSSSSRTSTLPFSKRKEEAWLHDIGDFLSVVNLRQREIWERHLAGPDGNFTACLREHEMFSSRILASSVSPEIAVEEETVDPLRLALGRNLATAYLFQYYTAECEKQRRRAKFRSEVEQLYAPDEGGEDVDIEAEKAKRKRKLVAQLRWRAAVATVRHACLEIKRPSSPAAQVPSSSPLQQGPRDTFFPKTKEHLVADSVRDLRSITGRELRMARALTGTDAPPYHRRSPRLVDKIPPLEFLSGSYSTQGGEQSAFGVALDHFANALVIFFRGSKDLMDVISNAAVAPVPLFKDSHPVDEIVHAGFRDCALHALEHIEERKLLLRLPASYSLVVAGHSLGAGCAAVLGFLLARRYPELRTRTGPGGGSSRLKCLLVAPPGLTCSKKLREESLDYMLTVVNGQDLVPRSRPLSGVVVRSFFNECVRKTQFSKKNLLDDLVEERSGKPLLGCSRRCSVLLRCVSCCCCAPGGAWNKGCCRGGRGSSTSSATRGRGRGGRKLRGGGGKPTRKRLKKALVLPPREYDRGDDNDDHAGKIDIHDGGAGAVDHEKMEEAPVTTAPESSTTLWSRLNIFDKIPDLKPRLLQESAREHAMRLWHTSEMRHKLFAFWHTANVSVFHPASPFNVLCARKFHDSSEVNPAERCNFVRDQIRKNDRLRVCVAKVKLRCGDSVKMGDQQVVDEAVKVYSPVEGPGGRGAGGRAQAEVQHARSTRSTAVFPVHVQQQGYDSESATDEDKDIMKENAASDAGGAKTGHQKIWSTRTTGSSSSLSSSSSWSGGASTSSAFSYEFDDDGTDTSSESDAVEAEDGTTTQRRRSNRKHFAMREGDYLRVVSEPKRFGVWVRREKQISSSQTRQDVERTREASEDQDHSQHELHQNSTTTGTTTTRKLHGRAFFLAYYDILAAFAIDADDIETRLQANFPQTRGSFRNFPKARVHASGSVASGSVMKTSDRSFGSSGTSSADGGLTTANEGRVSVASVDSVASVKSTASSSTRNALAKTLLRRWGTSALSSAADLEQQRRAARDREVLRSGMQRGAHNSVEPEGEAAAEEVSQPLEVGVSAGADEEAGDGSGGGAAKSFTRDEVEGEDGGPDPPERSTQVTWFDSVGVAEPYLLSFPEGYLPGKLLHLRRRRPAAERELLAAAATNRFSSLWKRVFHHQENKAHGAAAVVTAPVPASPSTSEGEEEEEGASETDGDQHAGLSEVEDHSFVRSVIRPGEGAGQKNQDTPHQSARRAEKTSCSSCCRRRSSTSACGACRARCGQVWTSVLKSIDAAFHSQYGGGVDEFDPDRLDTAQPKVSRIQILDRKLERIVADENDSVLREKKAERMLLREKSRKSRGGAKSRQEEHTDAVSHDEAKDTANNSKGARPLAEDENLTRGDIPFSASESDYTGSDRTGNGRDLGRCRPDDETWRREHRRMQAEILNGSHLFSALANVARKLPLHKVAIGGVEEVGQQVEEQPGRGKKSVALRASSTSGRPFSRGRVSRSSRESRATVFTAEQASKDKHDPTGGGIMATTSIEDVPLAQELGGLAGVILDGAGGEAEGVEHESEGEGFSPDTPRDGSPDPAGGGYAVRASAAEALWNFEDDEELGKDKAAATGIALLFSERALVDAAVARTQDECCRCASCCRRRRKEPDDFGERRRRDSDLRDSTSSTARLSGSAASTSTHQPDSTATLEDHSAESTEVFPLRASSQRHGRGTSTGGGFYRPVEDVDVDHGNIGDDVASTSRVEEQDDDGGNVLSEQYFENHMLQFEKEMQRELLVEADLGFYGVWVTDAEFKFASVHGRCLADHVQVPYVAGTRSVLHEFFRE